MQYMYFGQLLSHCARPRVSHRSCTYIYANHIYSISVQTQACAPFFPLQLPPPPPPSRIRLAEAMHQPDLFPQIRQQNCKNGIFVFYTIRNYIRCTQPTPLYSKHQCATACVCTLLYIILYPYIYTHIVHYTVRDTHEKASEILLSFFFFFFFFLCYMLYIHIFI